MIKVIVFDLWDTTAYKTKKQGSIGYLWKKTGKKGSYRSFLKAFEKNYQVTKKFDHVNCFGKTLKDLGIKSDKIEELALIRKDYEQKFAFYSYVFPLLNKLKKNYKIGLLSNTNSEEGERIKKSKIGKYVDKFFFSYEIGSIKPNAKNFKAVLNYFKVKANEVLMVGNNKDDDYLASKKNGFNAIHFKDGRQVKRELKKMGVL